MRGWHSLHFVMSVDGRSLAARAARATTSRACARLRLCVHVCVMRVARCEMSAPVTVPRLASMYRLSECSPVLSYTHKTDTQGRRGGSRRVLFTPACARDRDPQGGVLASRAARAAGTLRHADGDAPPASLARKAKAGAWHGEGVASPQRAVSPRTHKHRHTYHAARRPATATHSATCHHALGHLFPSPRARLPSGAALGAVGQATLPPHRWDGGPGQMATEGTVAHPSTCAVLTSSWAA